MFRVKPEVNNRLLWCIYCALLCNKCNKKGPAHDRVGPSYNELYCCNECYSIQALVVSTEPLLIILFMMFKPLAGSFNLIPTTL